MERHGRVEGVMNMEEKNTTFDYTYSAREQAEIKKIREKYAPPSEKEISMEQLRRLDASATKGATVVALAIGVISTLLFGIGLCCAMVPGWERYFIPGIVVGAAGIAGVTAAYPVYTRLVRSKREKLAPEILRLTEELMK